MPAKTYIDLLSDDVKGRAYYAEGEAAWPRQEALFVIDCLTSSCYAVLGGEIWLATSPGPTIPSPYIYTWEVSPWSHSENWIDFVNRANAESERFVREFAWDINDKAHLADTPYFNLTVCMESEYGRH
jgi:hypothetical protein